MGTRRWLLRDEARSGRDGSLLLAPLELLDRLAALMPPPRIHCHRYFGVLAPNAPYARRSPPAHEFDQRISW
jgi:hypothetical protein